MARVEVVTVGIDEAVAGIGSDPSGRSANMGLRIPSLALQTQTGKNAPPYPQLARYLFLLASFSIPAGGSARIRGMRKYLSLGFNAGTGGNYRPVEQEIKSPLWHPPGGNVSWHIMDLGPPQGTGTPGSAGPIDGTAFRSSLVPALLYEALATPNGYYISTTKYLPPNGGQPYGTPLLEGGFATRYDLDERWRSSHAWDSMDVPVCGPTTVAVYASVRQADPTVPNYALPALAPSPGASGYGAGLSEEEQFLVNFPGANYWRIACGLIVDT